MMKNQWSDKKAAAAVRSVRRAGVPKPLADCIYASRLLGADRKLVLHGGGNTSVKAHVFDLSGMSVEGLHVKASGHDLADIEANGFTALDLAQLRRLEELNALSDIDMLAALTRAKLRPSESAPSVETLLHAFLPAPYIFHSHANAVLALTNQSNGKSIVEKICGDEVIVLPYAMSGFALAKRAAAAVRRSPGAKALVVMNHGVFTFGKTAKDAYGHMIDLVNRAENRLRSGRRNIFPAARTTPAARHTDLAPVLRGALLRHMPGGAILDFRSNKAVRAFVNGRDLSRYGQAGPVTPDHVIWTKAKPLILDIDADVGRAVDGYAAAYAGHFKKLNGRRGPKMTMRDPAPRVALVPRSGLYGIGETARSAAIAADLAETAIDVITLAEKIGRFAPASAADIFDVEYWPPEVAKLTAATRRSLEGHVVLVTGGGSGIGAETARTFRLAGAEVVVTDLNGSAAKRVAAEFGGFALQTDVTDRRSVRRAFEAAVKVYGGIDIVISNAGAAWQGEIGTVSDRVLRDSFELNFFAHQTVAQNAVRVMRAQNSAGRRGGCLLFNTSKQAVNPGKNFGPYGLPKAGTFFLVRQYALDHGKDGVRANGVNADRIRSGLLTDGMIAERSSARGLSRKDYMTGNLLGREVTVEDVAKAFLDLALSPSTTGAVLTVDGGNIEAALR